MRRHGGGAVVGTKVGITVDGSASGIMIDDAARIAKIGDRQDGKRN